MKNKTVRNAIAFAAICFCVMFNNAIAADSIGHDRIQPRVNPRAKNGNTPTQLTGRVGQWFSESLGIPPQDTFTTTGLLPPGLTIGTSAKSPDVITLHGTPVMAVTDDFTVTFRGVEQSTQTTKLYSITILSASSSPTPTTETLTVNVVEVGGTANSGNFNLTVQTGQGTGNTTSSSGPAQMMQSYEVAVGATYTVKETTALASANYTPTFSSGCIGTMGQAGATCNVTNTFATPVTTPTPTNLIPNSNLTSDVLIPGTPDHWLQGGYGTNTPTFSYPVPACGGTGVNVSIGAYTDGDAKWYPDPMQIPVTPNATYAISFSYLSNVTSTFQVQITPSDGTADSYIQIATPPPTSGTTCGTVTGTFTAAPNAAFATLLPFINSANSSLTTTNFSMTLANGNSASDNFCPNGCVTIRIDDGLASSNDNGGPILDTAKIPATWYIIGSLMLGAQETIYPSADNPLAGSITTTPTSVTYSGIYPDPTQTHFTFSDTYTSSGPSTITVSYTAASDNATTSLVIGSTPSGTSKTATFSFTLPALATSSSLTFNHALTDAGTLTAANPLLTQTIGGYMSAADVLARQAKSDEIGNHTQRHADLLELLNNPAGATIPAGQAGADCPDTGPCPAGDTPADEIDKAETTLLGIGATPVKTFAYPYGDGAGNTTIEGLVQAEGLIAASSTNPGYNTKATDPYNLNVQIVDITVTDPATVTAWIDYAAKNKVWLILLFHNIETSASTLTDLKEVDGTTTAIFQAVVSYAAQQRATNNLIVDTVYNVMTKYFNQ